MAEAAAEAHRAGMETSIDTPDALTDPPKPPQAAAAPGPLETFGLTVRKARGRPRWQCWIIPLCEIFLIPHNRRASPFAPWVKSTCSCQTSRSVRSMRASTADAPSMCWRYSIALQPLESRPVTSHPAALRACATHPPR
jgi:hypothetical protein